MSTYREDILDTLDYIKGDMGTIKEELSNILDLDNIEDIKIAISETIQTVDRVIGEFK